MLDRRPKTIWGMTHQQRYSVDFSYPLVFTRDAFNPDNPVLDDILRSREPDKRHRAAIFVGEGVGAALPDLELRIRCYAAAHHDALQVAGDVVRVPHREKHSGTAEAVKSALIRPYVPRLAGARRHLPVSNPDNSIS